MQLCLSIHYEAGSEGIRRLLRQIPKAVQFAYAPPDRTPILSGCCRDPRTKTEAAMGRTLRLTMAPYCDQGCAESCPMLRAIRFPNRTIAETEYAHIDRSDLWMPTGGYGEAGHFAYRQLALLACLTKDRIVDANAPYLVLLSEGRYPNDSMRKILKRFHDDGLAPIIDRSCGRTRREVPVLTPDQLCELEQRLGVKSKRQSNIREARRQRDRYGDHAYAILTDAEKLAAWTA
jgi:hypothetical protein